MSYIPSTAPKGTRVWTCDECHKRETWRKGWGYLPGIISEANLSTTEGHVFPFVTCSPECENAALDRLCGTSKRARREAMCP